MSAVFVLNLVKPDELAFVVGVLKSFAESAEMNGDEQSRDQFLAAALACEQLKGSVLQ